MSLLTPVEGCTPPPVTRRKIIHPWKYISIIHWDKGCWPTGQFILGNIWLIDKTDSQFNQVELRDIQKIDDHVMLWIEWLFEGMEVGEHAMPQSFIISHQTNSMTEVSQTEYILQYSSLKRCHWWLALRIKSRAQSIQVWVSLLNPV